MLKKLLSYKDVKEDYEGEVSNQKFTTLKKKIKEHALNSFYRLNASGADLYTFSFYKNEKGKYDFQGGYAWLHSPGTWDSDWALNLEDDQFYVLEKENEK